MTEISSAEIEVPLPQKSRLRRIAIRLLCLFGGIVIGVVIAIWLAKKTPPPDFTDQQFAAAQEKWKAAAIENYDLSINQSGGVKQHHEVQVRSGIATKLVTDGKSIENQGSRDFWSIDGLFKVMNLDRINCSDPKGVFKVDPNEKIYQQAEFDPVLGYPQRYRFTIPRGGRDVWLDIRLTKVESAKR